MRTGKRIGVLIVCAGALLAIGANPRFLEELRVGGGYGDAGSLNSPAGGVDIEDDGTINTDGPVYSGTSMSSAAWPDFDTFGELQAIVADKTILNSEDWAAPGAIGVTTPAAGRFSTLEAVTSFQLDDHVKALFGTGSDAAIYYDGTDLIIDPQEVGSGDLYVKNGKVGIGTPSPQKMLHVYEASSGGTANSGSLLVLESDGSASIALLGGTASSPAIRFGDSDNSNAGSFTYNHSTDNLATVVNGAVVMNIDSSGKVGVGTPTPSVALDVVGAFRVSLDATVDGGDIDNSTGAIEIEDTLHVDSATNRAGVNQTSPNAMMEVSGDLSSTVTTGDYAQLEVTGGTNHAKRLALGFNTTGDYGVVQALENASGFRELRLNPGGGTVTTGSGLFTAGGDARVLGAFAATTLTTFAADDTTPSVSGGNLFRGSTSQSPGNDTSAFDDGVTGQVITVIAGDADYGIADGGSMHLAGGVNWAPDSANDTIQLVCDGSAWFELSRSDN